ncbi:MAG: CBS domain-containing protein [Leptospirillum sp.]|nr:CBS domain-containing protein [Nitrospiraceae bacterium]
MTAKDLMSRSVISISPEASLRELADLLVLNRINGVVVSNVPGEFLGVVGEHDLIHHEKPLHIPTVISLFDAWLFLEPPSHLKKEIERLAATQVRDIYQHNPPTVSPEAQIADLAGVFEKTGVDILPVLEKGKLVGVIGRGDLVRAMADGEAT